MKLHTGDHVVVISGKDKGKTGSILRVLHSKGRVVASGINMRTRHMKATPQRAGQKIQYEASIDISNIMLIDPKTKKRTRIGIITNDKGQKRRVAKASGEELPIKKAGATTTKKKTDAQTEEKEVKKTTKNAEQPVKKTEEVKKEAPVAKEETSKPPAKKPFWKKVISFGDEAADEASEDSNTSKDHSNTPSAHRTTSRGS